MKTQLSFEQAATSLQDFLVAEKKPSKLQWVFREDLLLHKRRVFLRWPLPQENESLAARQYEIGRERPSECLLKYFALMETTPSATCWCQMIHILQKP